MVAGFIILPINTYFAKKISKKSLFFRDTKQTPIRNDAGDNDTFPSISLSFYNPFISFSFTPPHTFWTIFFRFISFTYICETTKIHFQ